jgi:hypothetical protein
VNAPIPHFYFDIAFKKTRLRNMCLHHAPLLADQQQFGSLVSHCSVLHTWYTHKLAARSRQARRAAAEDNFGSE